MRIKLTRGKYTEVDNTDYEYLNQWKWLCDSEGYACRSEHYKKSCGKRACHRIRMHRVVNNTPEAVFTDHVNGDKLDNRRNNLRNCTTSQNQMNRRSHKNSSSKYKGVGWHKLYKKWTSSIRIDGKLKHLGYFTSEDEAALAYNEIADKHFGNFARLNNV